ncbi:MAG: hypothetical protein JST90_10075 [Bacteroidetes bacterium]|nr:hypothetical protein [Bacteroidota bacterium]
MLAKSEPIHQPGIGDVFNSLQHSAKKLKAIGVIDEGKRNKVFTYYREFAVKKTYPNFKLLTHPNGLHSLIETKGEGFEKFITLCADEAVVKHKILADFKRLRQLAKSPAAEFNQDLKDLINTLIQKKSPTLLKMREILADYAD